MHIGSQLLSLDAYRPAVEAIATLGDFPVYNLGGGLGVAYTADQQPPSIEEYVEVQVNAANELLGRGKKLLIEPGRSLVANACVTLYTVETVKRNVSTWVGVDGGMSDNLRPMLYGSVYEAFLADRAAAAGTGERCHVAGKHCESGDVIVRDVPLDDPQAGRRARHARDGRLRPRDGEQLQRHPAPAGDLLQGRRRARRRAARDLRRPGRS